MSSSSLLYDSPRQQSSEVKVLDNGFIDFVQYHELAVGSLGAGNNYLLTFCDYLVEANLRVLCRWVQVQNRRRYRIRNLRLRFDTIGRLACPRPTP